MSCSFLVDTFLFLGSIVHFCSHTRYRGGALFPTNSLTFDRGLTHPSAPAVERTNFDPDVGL